MTDYEGPGAVRSDHPMGASHSQQYDHDAHREELFGQDREEALRGEGIEASQANRKKESHITDDEARRMYETYWSTDKSYGDIAREFSRDKSHVGKVMRRDRLADATAEIAEDLGHPEDMEWTANEPHNVNRIDD